MNASDIAQNAINNAAKNSYINPDALDQRIVASTQNMFDMSKTMGANIFGDMFAQQAPTWQKPKDPEKVEDPDFQGIYDNVTSGF